MKFRDEEGEEEEDEEVGGERELVQMNGALLSRFN